MKMRSRAAGIFAGCAIACAVPNLAFAAQKTVSGQQALTLGVVDFREVALGSKAGKAAKARLEKLAEKLQKEMKAEQAKLTARQKELDAALPRLTVAEREDRTASLERDGATFQRLLEDKTEELKNAETESIQDLANRFDGILKAYAAEKGFTVILEAQRPGILYFDKNLDISSEVIKRFDRTSPK
ncbi:MAG: OmpH family outer membrane protein [candidate division NC10 bacterium]|nr:OmpH family outer membrane protein [candidate division NC10 bacterium]